MLTALMDFILIKIIELTKISALSVNVEYNFINDVKKSSLSNTILNVNLYYPQIKMYIYHPRGFQKVL